MKTLIASLAIAFMGALFAAEPLAEPDKGPGHWESVQTKTWIESTYKPCPQCGGKGTVKENDLKAIDVKSVRCPNCGGDGKIVDVKGHDEVKTERVWMPDWKAIAELKAKAREQAATAKQQEVDRKLQEKVLAGDPDAICNLALSKRVADADRPALLENAAKRGSRTAMATLGAYYENGRCGVSVNYVEAMKWYQLSDASGSQAMRLSRILSKAKQEQAAAAVAAFVEKYLSGGAQVELPGMPPLLDPEPLAATPIEDSTPVPATESAPKRPANVQTIETKNVPPKNPNTKEAKIIKNADGSVRIQSESFK